MFIQSRPYHDAADLARMIGFLEAINAGGLSMGYFHLGDLIWGMYQNTLFDPHENIRLWERAGLLVGFAWFDKPNSVNMQIGPTLRGQGQLEAEMLEWAGERAHACQQGAQEPPMLWTWCMADDQWRDAFLVERGFARGSYEMLHFHCDLMGPIADAPPPAQIVVRSVGGEHEYQERVDTHREVWQPSKVTLEAYRRLRAAPIYRPDLDLVAALPDGNFASYCICWLDAANQTGEFEPVGTRPAARGQGIGRAVIVEGLRRLRGAGARAAIVYTPRHNQPAQRLYLSAGFQIVSSEFLYGRAL
jgi:ribosomal protein S18 acetylase RimI-like enzyme